MHFLPFDIRVVPHTLLFKQPAHTSRGVYTERKVWYLVLSSTDPQIRFTGLGECAPLHDLSCDYSADYEQRLRDICRQTVETQNLDTERLRPYPSILFGLQSAFRSAAGSLAGDYRKLYASDFTAGRRGISINGLVWMGAYEQMCRRIEEKLSQGFRCIKLKIGSIDFDKELDMVRRIRSRYDARTVELRLDANGGFAPDDALDKLKRLAVYDIHSIEQPIRQGQWSEMARLCVQSPIPIALDEELIGVNDFKQKNELLDQIRPQYIILKPSLHGAFTGAGEWMSLARDRGIGYWTTSALESNVGLNAIAQWCAAIDPDTVMPQGLGTGQLFVKNYDNVPLSLEGQRLWYGSEPQRKFLREVDDFKQRWQEPSPTITVHTSGSTGTPKPLEAGKIQMWNSALRTIAALGLQEGNSALLAMPVKYIAGQMMLVRSFAGGLPLVAVAPSSHPFAGMHEAPDFAALTPMQVYESLKDKHEASLLRRTLCLIVGGGSISPELAGLLRSFPHPVYSTYGMTETLSHVALRRLNGPSASDWYTPLSGVEITLSERGTLCVYAPDVCDRRLETNDLAEVLDNGCFRILGRVDNVVVSGGLKLHIEDLEQQLTPFLDLPFGLTSVPDKSLGEALVLLYEGDENQAERLKETCRLHLDKYTVPRHYLPVVTLPKTETGKPARAEMKHLALERLNSAAHA